MRHAIPFIIIAFLLILVPYVIFQPILEEERLANKEEVIIEKIELIETEKPQPKVCNPNFDQYSDVGVFTSKPAPVDFSTNENALEYRGKIKKIAATGVNFAGEYSAITWTCGPRCYGAGIVNSKTGAIIAYGLSSSFNYDFNKNSRLFIVNPKKNLPTEKDNISEDIKTAYYEIKENELKLICEIDINSDITSDDEGIIQE